MSHTCTTLPLGWTVWGVQGEQGVTFIHHLLVNLHLHKAAIKFLSLLFPLTRSFSSVPQITGIAPCSWNTHAWLLCVACLYVCI